LSTEAVRLLNRISELRKRLNEEIIKELSVDRYRGVNLSRLIPSDIRDKFREEYYIQAFFTRALKEAIERAKEKHGISIAKLSDVKEIAKEWCKKDVKKSLTILNYRAYLDACESLANLRVPDFILIETVESMIKKYGNLPLLIPKEGPLWKSIVSNIERLGLKTIDTRGEDIVLVTSKDELIRDIRERIRERESEMEKVRDEIDRLRTEVFRLQRRYEEVKAERDELGVEHSRLEGDVNDVMKQLFELCRSKNYNSIKECINSEKSNKLINELYSKYKKLYGKLTALKNQIDQRERILKDLGERINMYEAALDEKKRNLERVKYDIESLRQLLNDVSYYVTNIPPEEYLKEVLNSLGNILDESTKRVIEQILQERMVDVVGRRVRKEEEEALEELEKAYSEYSKKEEEIERRAEELKE